MSVLDSFWSTKLLTFIRSHLHWIPAEAETEKDAATFMVNLVGGSAMIVVVIDIANPMRKTGCITSNTLTVLL